MLYINVLLFRFPICIFLFPVTVLFYLCSVVSTCWLFTFSFNEGGGRSVLELLLQVGIFYLFFYCLFPCTYQVTRICYDCGFSRIGTAQSPFPRPPHPLCPSPNMIPPEGSPKTSFLINACGWWDHPVSANE